MGPWKSELVFALKPGRLELSGAGHGTWTLTLRFHILLHGAGPVHRHTHCSALCFPFLQLDWLPWCLLYWGRARPSIGYRER